MFWNRPLIIGLLVVVTALSWWRLQSGGDDIRRSQLMMGTVVEIVATGQDNDLLDEAVTAAFAEMARLEKLLSKYQSTSDISRLSLSESGGEIAQETADVFALGLDVARKSDGAFDLTLGKLKSLWGFDKEAPTIPEVKAISEALTGIGPLALSLEGRSIQKHSPQLQIDLGGIAKGYAVDRAISILKERGVTSAAVNAGGDMYLLGQRMKRPWKIGIQHPRQEAGILETVQVSDRAVVTSGDYERFFEQEGVRYHHIFDPKSGMPARSCQSVTVIAESVALSDALATAVFVLGPEAGLKLLDQYSQVEGLITSADGSRHASNGWTKYQVAQ